MSRKEVVMETYDSVSGDSLVVGDLVVIDNEQVEVQEITDDIDSLTVRGYSFDTGDIETYDVDFDKQYDLWRA